MTPFQSAVEAEILARKGHRRGSEMYFLAPCHDEQRPSARWNPDKLTWFCDPCDCGGGIKDLAERLGIAEPARQERQEFAAEYDYRDEAGKLLFQVVRRMGVPKADAFRQRRPDGPGGWVWKLGDTRRVLYRLPELIEADPARCVLIPEGEKDVDRLRALGVVATCNPHGAGKWRPQYAEPLRGRNVAILPDNDGPGLKHAEAVARSLDGLASSVRIVELPGLPEKGDVSDWLDAGGTPEELRALVKAAAVRGPAEASSSSLSLSGDDGDDGDADPSEAPPSPRGVAARLAAATSTLGKMSERYNSEVRWLADGYIALDELTMVVAPAASFKSWMLADLARAVHTGGLWLGSMRVPQGPVLFLEQERARNLVYQTERLADGWEQDLSGIITVEPCGLELGRPEWQTELVDMVARVKPLLVVINSFRAVFRGKPVDSAEVAAALGWLGHMAEKQGCAVVVVDATNRAGANGIVRGSAAQSDSGQKEYEADTILHVERKRDEVGRAAGPASVFTGKRRHGESGPPFTFDVVPYGNAEGRRVLWLDETTVERSDLPRPMNGRDRVLAALPADGGRRPIKEIAIAADLEDGSARNVLTRLRRDGLTETDGRGNWGRAGSSSSSLSLGDDGDDDTPFLAALPAQESPRANGRAATSVLTIVAPQPANGGPTSSNGHTPAVFAAVAVRDDAAPLGVCRDCQTPLRDRQRQCMDCMDHDRRAEAGAA